MATKRGKDEDQDSTQTAEPEAKESETVETAESTELAATETQTKDGEQPQAQPEEKKVAREYVTLTAPEGFKNVKAIAVRARVEALKGHDSKSIGDALEAACLKVLQAEFGLVGEDGEQVEGADLDLIQRDDLKLATRFEVFTTETKPTPKETAGKAKKLDIGSIIARAQELHETGTAKKEAMEQACQENGITPDQLREMMGFLAA